MKNLKLTLLFTLLSFMGYSQTKLSLSQLQYAPGGSYFIGSDLTGKATWINTIPFSMLTGTTGVVGDLFSTSSYTNPSWLSSLAWSKITGTPTTLLGYGITNGVLNTSSITINGSSQLLSGSSFTVQPTLSDILGYGNTTGGMDITSDNLNNILTINNFQGVNAYSTDGANQLSIIQANTGLSSIAYISSSDGASTSMFKAENGVGTMQSTSTNIFDAPANNFPQLTASKVPYIDASNNLVTSTVTPTELNLLGGVTGSLVSTAITNTATNIPLFSGATTQTSTTSFQYDSSTDILKLGSSYVGKTTMGGITTNALEFKSGSTIGIFSFKNSNNNSVPRVYIMPTGTVTGTTAKFELFNTDYSTGSPNYSGFNLFTNNTQSTIWMGGNVAGSATRLKMVIAGKFNASVVDAGSSRIDFETNEDITINTTGGNVGVKQSSPQEALHVGGNVRISGLTASQIVETNASKTLASVAKGTAYNKDFGVTAGTVLEGNYTPTLAISGSSLYTVGGNTVVLSGGGSDSQTLSISGASLSISGGNTVIIPSAGTASLAITGNTLSVVGSNSVVIPAPDATYTNYTPTFTGFSSAPTIATGDARYAMLGPKTCHVIIEGTSGTSNATTTTFTLPFNPAATSTTTGRQYYVTPVINNNVHVIGSMRTRGGSTNVVDVYNGAVGATWTNTGNKNVFVDAVFNIE